MLLQRILWSLYVEVETPPAYGWYHILCWLILAATVIVTCVFAKKINNKFFYFLLLSMWAVMVIGEIYRELNYSVNINTGEFKYNWEYFPFQFCSSPLYALPLAILIPFKRLKQFYFDFLATYALFAGLIVMIIPGDVFCGNLIINIQTMVHHGGMVATAVLLYATGKVKFSLWTLVRSTMVFVGFLVVAIILNATVNKPDFNMFYIDWVEGCHLPLLGDIIYPNVPYPVFLIIYTFGFMLAATVVFLVAFAAHGIRALFTAIGRGCKKEKNQQ